MDNWAIMCQFKELNEKSLHRSRKNQPVLSSSKMKTQNIFWNWTHIKFLKGFDLIVLDLDYWDVGMEQIGGLFCQANL
jgi:hypothetical protein